MDETELKVAFAPKGDSAVEAFLFVCLLVFGG